jgi:DNA polymerase-3 subunit epsilon
MAQKKKPTLYAITDIETTGSYASGNSIIEIGVCVHDGEQVVREYHTLLDPGKRLPSFITALTNIHDEMLEGAPTFHQIADELEEVLKDTVFVAHNVSFDYSFIRAEFAAIGRQWNSKRLCTVRLARRAFPGYRSYSLGNICAVLGINNEAAHRALGDARAAKELFEKCLTVLSEQEISKMISRTSGEIYLPPNLAKQEYDALPEKAGVYYLLNEKGKPIYIGKARNLKKRVKQHFTSATEGKRNQDFMRQIHHVTFEETGTELIAYLLEDYDIRKHWPEHNRAQKKQPEQVHVIAYKDQNGYDRLAMQCGNKFISAIKIFSTRFAARTWLMEMAQEFELEMRLLGLDMFDIYAETVPAETHNQRLADALEAMLDREPSFIIKDLGRNETEYSYVVIEKGKLKGYCFIDDDIQSEDVIHDSLKPLPVTETNASIIASICERERLKNHSTEIL